MVNIYSVLDTPELLEQICAHLTAHQRNQCVLVSHRWRELFTPQLWAEMHHVEETFFEDEAFREKVRSHRHLIQSLFTSSDKVLEAVNLIFEHEDFTPRRGESRMQRLTDSTDDLPLTELRRLDLSWSGQPKQDRRANDADWGEYTWDFSCLCIVQKSPRLVNLSLCFASFNYSEFPWCLEGLHCLRQLSLRGFHDAPIFLPKLIELLDSLPSQLDDLTLDFDVFVKKNDAVGFGKGDRPLALTKLAIRGTFFTIPPSVISRLCNNCPRVQRVRLLGQGKGGVDFLQTDLSLRQLFEKSSTDNGGCDPSDYRFDIDTAGPYRVRSSRSLGVAYW